MTQEPNQSDGTSSRRAESHLGATTAESRESSNELPTPLYDSVPEGWSLAIDVERPVRVGARAAHAALLSRARLAEEQGNTIGAAEAFRDIAETCWAAGSDYVVAIAAARRVLELFPEHPIRNELARRLEQLGAYRAAIEILEGAGSGSNVHKSVTVQRKLAELKFRMGDAKGSASHFAELARTQPDATDCLSAIGVMAGWAPEQVSRERGVVAWHEAGRRYKARGSLLSAFESIQRAFELDPASPLAAERLAQELQSLGRRDAADEVWRKSAVAAGESARHDIRAVLALEAGDVVAAFAAMLDGRTDCTFEASQLLAGVDHLLSPQAGVAHGFDTVLAELGCAEWLAVRLEAGPLLERWTEEVSCHVTLARLEASYFEHLNASREALVRAMIVQPADSEARARLSSWSNGDLSPDPLLRALVQSARTAQGGMIARQLAGEILGRVPCAPHTAALRLWALDRLKLTGGLTEAQRLEQQACAELVAQHRAALPRLEAVASEMPRQELIAAMRTLEQALALDPSRATDHLAIVVAEVEANPDDALAQSIYVELLDVAARLVLSPARDEKLRAAIAQAPRLLGERGCIAQAKFYLRLGQVETALSSLQRLLDEKAPSVRGLFWLFTLARRFRDPLTAARAIERASSSFKTPVRGVFEALAAELYLEAHCHEEVVRLISSAVRTAQNTSRLVAIEVRLSDSWEPRAGSESVERALSRVLPDAHLCHVLARAHRQIGEPDVALAWIQRALSLRPGDLEWRNELLQLALEMGDLGRVADVLRELFVQALPVSSWVKSAASALAWMTPIDPAKALELGKVLLDCVGASDHSLRAAWLELAHVGKNESFAIEVLERAAALEPESVPVLLALAERHWKSNHIEAGLRAALRAAQAGAKLSDWETYVVRDAAADLAEVQLVSLELQRLSVRARGDSVELGRVLAALARARFELAEDHAGAIEIWHELAETAGPSAWALVAREMAGVLGRAAAVARLQSEAQALPAGSEERGKILGLAAELAIEAGDVSEAQRAFELALHSAPECICLLPWLEQVTLARGDAERLEALYSVAEQSALGVFGDRSLHYRAARRFEQAGQLGPAQRHALLAFEVLPQNHPAWQTLVRVSRKAHHPQPLAAAAMHVAEVARDRAQAEQWLARAYDEFGDTADELRLRFDLAIRILVGAPSVKGIRRVADCTRLMQNAGVEEIDFMRMRFERALESLIGDLDGPDGARLGIATSQVAAVELGRFDISASALFAALKADADLEEFAELGALYVSRAKLASEAFEPALQRILDWLERPYVRAGKEAISLLMRLAVALADWRACTRIELHAQRTSQHEWLQAWIEGELLAQLFDGEDGRSSAVALAGLRIESERPEAALFLLECAARRFRNLPVDVAGSSDGTDWYPLRDQYWRAIEQMLSPETLGVLRSHLATAETVVPPLIVAELRVMLERRSLDRLALASALATLAFRGNARPEARVELLVEAATLAEEQNDLDAALVYFRAAHGIDVTSPAARFGFSLLTVRLGRHGDWEQAKLLLDATRGLASRLADEQRDVAVYLESEALQALGRPSDAESLLKDAERRLGPRPLVVLGLAEHAVRRAEPGLALEYFAAAMGGNLRKIRTKGQVSLEAARAAAAIADIPLALHWLEPALSDPLTRPDALALEAELQGAADGADTEIRRSAHQDAPDSSRIEPPGASGAERIPAVASARHQESRPGQSDPLLSPAFGETVLHELPIETPRSSSRRRGAPVSTSETSGPPTAMKAIASEGHSAILGLPVELSAVDSVVTAVEQLAASVEAPMETPVRRPGGLAGADEPASEVVAESSERVEPAEQQSDEPIAAQGILDAGVPVPDPFAGSDTSVEVSGEQAGGGNAAEGRAYAVEPTEPTAFELALASAEQVAREPEQLRSWFADGRRWLQKWPTSLRLAELVQAAARLESHASHAAALEQLVGVLRGDAKLLQPTDLSEQPVDPDGLRSLLLRGLLLPELEALSLVWDGAEHEFLREASDYEVTGVMRVIGTASPLSRIYAESARHFGMPKTPMFLDRTSKPMSSSVLLLSPTAALLGGEPGTEERAIGYEVGRALWATIPELSLLCSYGIERAPAIVHALALAFGPNVEQPKATLGEALRLAQVLWQTVRSRSQRRLREICGSELDFRRAWDAAGRSRRRAGLYVCGNLQTALHAATAELKVDASLLREKNWAEIGEAVPELADLFQFAASGGYADVRWHLGRTAQTVLGGGSP